RQRCAFAIFILFLAIIRRSSSYFWRFWRYESKETLLMRCHSLFQEPRLGGRGMGDDGKLHLHIPVPPTRPGDAPDFSHIHIPAAGTLARPEPLTGHAEMRELPFQLVRVLDDAGAAVGPWVPEIAPETLLAGLRAMLLTRIFDE